MGRNVKTLPKSSLWGVDILIFVSVGTQNIQFDRLLKSVDKQIEIGNINEEVIVQSGSSIFKSTNFKTVSFLPMDEFKRIISEARIIICHGGVGTITDGLRNNKIVIACPRLQKYGEHVNDHQLQIIENFGKMGYIIPLLKPDELDKALERAKTFKPKMYKSNTDNMIELIENYIDNN